MSDDAQVELHLQLRLFAALLISDVLSKHRSMVSEDIFAAPTAVRCTRTLLRLFDKLGRVPSKRTFVTELGSEHKANAKRCVKFAKRAFKLPTDEVQKIYGDELKDLIELAHAQKCIAEAMDLVNAGDRGAAMKAVSRAQTTSSAVDDGTWLDEDADERYKDDPMGRGRRWLTGYDDWDALTDGGPAVGELEVIVGGQGAGKTRMMNNLAVNAMKQGAYVVYLSYEMKKASIFARTDMITTGLPLWELKTDKGKRSLARARKAIERAGGNLFCVKFYPYSMDITQVGAYLRSLDPKPDVVFLDYFELLNITDISGSGNYWVDQARLYAQFHGIIEEMGCVGWGATQPGKGQWEGIEQFGQVEGSGGKSNALDGFWSIHLEKNKLETEGQFGIFGMKNRWGPPRRLLMFGVDMGCTNMIVSPWEGDGFSLDFDLEDEDDE